MADDPGIQLPDSQQAVQHGGGFAHHLVRCGEVFQIGALFQPGHQRLYTPVLTDVYPVLFTQDAGESTGVQIHHTHQITACVDGVIYDTWDCSEKCVYTAYQIVPVTTVATPDYNYYTVECNGDCLFAVQIVDVTNDTTKTVSVSKNQLTGYCKCLMDLGYKRFVKES